jgi:acetyl esterase
VHDFDTLDPELAPIARFMPAIDLSDPAAARSLIDRAMSLVMRRWPTAGAAVVTDEHLVPGPSGAGPVRVRSYRPAGTLGVALPAVLLLHGGGFVVGNLAAEHYKAQLVALDAGCVAFAVGYRLAPEHPFPAAVDDCAATLDWVVERAGELGVDPSRIAVAGTSSGAGLAASLTLLARERGGPSIAFQQLVFPVVDDRSAALAPSALFDYFGSGQAAVMWRHYLGGREIAELPNHAVPNRVGDLSGLPPAYILTAQEDQFRDSGIAYATRLMRGGVQVELHSFPGTFHGFDTAVISSGVARRAMAEQVAALARALGGRTPPPEGDG